MRNPPSESIFTTDMHITMCFKLYILPLKDDCKLSSEHEEANSIF